MIEQVAGALLSFALLDPLWHCLPIKFLAFSPYQGNSIVQSQQMTWVCSCVSQIVMKHMGWIDLQQGGARVPDYMISQLLLKICIASRFNSITLKTYAISNMNRAEQLSTVCIIAPMNLLLPWLWLCSEIYIYICFKKILKSIDIS